MKSGIEFQISEVALKANESVGATDSISKSTRGADRLEFQDSQLYVQQNQKKLFNDLSVYSTQ